LENPAAASPDAWRSASPPVLHRATSHAADRDAAGRERQFKSLCDEPFPDVLTVWVRQPTPSGFSHRSNRGRRAIRFPAAPGRATFGEPPLNFRQICRSISRSASVRRTTYFFDFLGMAQPSLVNAIYRPRLPHSYPHLEHDNALGRHLMRVAPAWDRGFERGIRHIRLWARTGSTATELDGFPSRGMKWEYCPVTSTIPFPENINRFFPPSSSLQPSPPQSLNHTRATTRSAKPPSAPGSRLAQPRHPGSGPAPEFHFRPSCQTLPSFLSSGACPDFRGTIKAYAAWQVSRLGDAAFSGDSHGSALLMDKQEYVSADAGRMPAGHGQIAEGGDRGSHRQ